MKSKTPKSYSRQILKVGFSFFILLISLPAYSQSDSLKALQFNAYGELYYSYDFSNPQNHKKSDFLYNHKRHNELNANLILLQANYLTKYYRANLGLMAGNYPQYNLSSEPTWAQFIYEANVGVKLFSKQNIWLEAGIMPSHIGFEGAISADCWTLTRSLLAENSPYYEAGVKLGYTSKNQKLNLSALYLNGWQQISKPNYIQKPSFGTQINFKLSNKILFNYSTFLGTDKPDNFNAIRQFHNFYLQYEPTDKFGIIAGYDVGRDKYTIDRYGIWYSPVLIIKQMINEKIKIAIRGEYYSDPKQIIILTGTTHGFQTFGFSSNLDFSINDKIKIRIEGKMFHSKDRIFVNENDNYSLTTNMTIKI
jgi:hypothetical protein